MNLEVEIKRMYKVNKNRSTGELGSFKEKERMIRNKNKLR